MNTLNDWLDEHRVSVVHERRMMMHIRTGKSPIALLAVTVVMLFVVSESARADVIYSSGFDGTQLVTINTVTGLGTTIGNFGYAATYGTAFAPNGTLYTLVNSYNNGTLATVNLVTGAATVVGGASGIPDLMVMEIASDGTLYTASWDTNTLYKMNTTTGAVTAIGPLGFTAIMDFAFDSSGTLWGVNSSDLWTINTATGAGTHVANLIGTDQCQMGLAFDSAGNLFATSYCSGNSPLYSIDETTGVSTIVGLTGIPNPHGGDILTSQTTVPEPSTLMLFATGLIGLLGYRWRHGKA